MFSVPVHRSKSVLSQTISRVVAYSSNNDGFVALSGRTAVVNLVGNTVNNPATATLLTLIGQQTDANSLVFDKTGLNIDLVTWPFLWAEIYPSSLSNSSKYCAELRFYDGDGILIDVSAKTKIGNMTSGGGLAAAFNGITSQSSSAGAASAGAISGKGYVGIEFSPL